MLTENISEKHKTDFQTPLEVCRYMCSLIPEGAKTVLEPTAGNGNMLKYLSRYHVTAPENFFELDKQEFDCVVMNPPFSAKYAHGVPAGLEKHGMRLGYHILTECMKLSNNIIALMPWFTISDSDVRLRYLKRFGMKSITALPRKTFQYARIQTCVMELENGYCGRTEFLVYDTITDNQYKIF